MKCQSRILRVYKTRKAEPIWPRILYPEGYVDNPEAAQYPLCGGDVTVQIFAVDEPYMGGSDARLDVEFACSGCVAPWISERAGIEEEVRKGRFDLTPYLAEESRSEKEGLA